MARKENSKMLSAPDNADMLPGNNLFLMLDEQSRKYTFLFFIQDELQVMEIDSVSNPERMPDGNWHAAVKVKKGKNPLGFLFASSFDFAVKSEVDTAKKLVIDIHYTEELDFKDEVVSIGFSQSNTGNDQLEKIAKYLFGQISRVLVEFKNGARTSQRYTITAPAGVKNTDLTIKASWDLDLKQYHKRNELDRTKNPAKWKIYLTTDSTKGIGQKAESEKFDITTEGELTTKIFVDEVDTTDDDEKKYNPSNPRLQLLELLRRILSVLR